MKPEQILTLGLTLVIGYLLYFIMAPFLTPIFWAIILSILFYPFYHWLKERLRLADSVVSFLTCTVIILFLTIPVTLLAVSLVDEMRDIYVWAEAYAKQSQQNFHSSPYFLLPYIKSIIGKYVDMDSFDIKDILLKGTKEAAGFLAQNIGGVVTNFTNFILNLVLTFFAMYYFFKDGARFMEYAKELLPLSKDDKEMIFNKNKKIIYATLYGGLLVAIVQGTVGGLSFWALGIPSPIFWGTIMTLMAFLPMVGPPVVWLPAAIYLFVKAFYIKALILVIIGTFVIGLIDNLLRPLIVSGKTNIHPLLLLFSILGALKAMGFIGIIAGPIILSLSLTVIDIYKAGYLKKTVDSEQ